MKTKVGTPMKTNEKAAGIVSFVLLGYLEADVPNPAWNPGFAGLSG